MKAKPLLLLLLFVAINLIAFSQFRCGFDEMHSRKMKSDPAYRARILENEKNVQAYLRKNKNRLSARIMGTTAALYTIPVVVHVIHSGGAIGTIYNPSDAQIQGAINYLNQIYSGSYPGMEGVGDVQIQFALAVRDPNCAPTSGIDRVDGSVLPSYSTYGIKLNGTNGETEVTVKNLDRWNVFDYYNIWVVNKIDGQDGTSGTFVGGYAYLPGAGPSIDGTVMLATQMAAGKKTMPHEIGHAFGLYHPFDDSAPTACAANTSCTTQGDLICDTDPITRPPDFSTCRTGTNPCTGTAYNINTEHNFMNYTSCYTLFTADQKARLLAFAGSLYRVSFSTSSALTPTNIIYPYTSPVASCTPTTSASGLSVNYAGIYNIEINNKHYRSWGAADDGGYLNGTTDCIKTLQLVGGNTYNIAVNVVANNSHQVKAWIDYNNDGAFDNLTEQIFSNPSFNAAATPTVSGSFTVPTTVTTNTVLRLRVIDDLIPGYPSTVPITSGCHNPVYGQAEDYPVVMPALIVLSPAILSFNGQMQNDYAELKWTTAQQENLKNFEIEKSTDGIDFYRIGMVTSSGGRTGDNYSFKDLFPNDVNYYRLRMNEMNAVSTVSKVVVVKNENSRQKVWVTGNPFTDYIDLQMVNNENKINLQLVNIAGSIVAEKEVISPKLQERWWLSNKLSSGIYILKITTTKDIFTYKLVKD